MTSLELLICVVLVFLSAYMSASEIALFSLSKFQLRSLKENFRPVHRKIKRLLSDPGGLLITTLVANEVLNIALASFITEFVSRNQASTHLRLSHIPDWASQTLIGILIATPIILLFCEITPKVIAARMNRLIAILTAGPLNIIYDLFKPIRYALKITVAMIIRLIPSENKRRIVLYPEVNSTDTTKHETILKESDFLLMVEEGHKEGAIQEEELELIRNVFELNNTPVSEISTPLSQVLTLPVTTTIKGALAAVRNQKYSRIPIIGMNRKEIVGILYSKDLLRSKIQADSFPDTVTSLMRKPFFVPPTMKLNALFRRFKQHKIHMAIVKAPNGEITGVVTMNDILDALFEDLFTEEDLRKKSEHPPSRMHPHHKKQTSGRKIK